MISPAPLYLAFVAGLVSSSPIQRRALSQNDIIGLQLADYLENMELSLYTGGCETISSDQWTAAGFPSTFHEDICTIAEQQQNQTEYIATLLEPNGVSVPPACSYNFAYNTPTDFVLLANRVTSISLGAYLGSLNDLSPELQTVAASILSVEARHDAVVRSGMGASPFPTDQDVPLSSIWAFNLAQKFITSCSQQLPIDVLPPLNYLGATDHTLEFAWDPSAPSANNFTVKRRQNDDGSLHMAFVHQNISDPIYQPIQMTGQGQGTVPTPEGLSGVVYACLTASSGGLTLGELTTTGTLAGPVQLVLS